MSDYKTVNVAKINVLSLVQYVFLNYIDV